MFGYMVLHLRVQIMLSLHCFSLSSSADVAFLAYPGEAGEIKLLIGSFSLVSIGK